MKKTVKIALVIALVGVLASGCLPNPRVPISCNGKTVRVKLEDAAAFKEVCAETSTTVAQQTECQPATIVAEAVEPVVVEKQPSVAVSSALECSYDYSVMPTGRDSEGRPLADHGISYPGSIVGPALVQLDSKTVVSVFPGEVYDVPENSTTWKYIGDSSCLLSQYKSFPGKDIFRLAN